MKANKQIITMVFGLTKDERKLLEDAIGKTLRRIKYKRRLDKKPSPQYIIQSK